MSALLRVLVEPGAFRSERAVSFADTAGTRISLLVSASALDDGRLRVRLVDTIEPGIAHIEMLQEPFGGPRRVFVRLSEVLLRAAI